MTRQSDQRHMSLGIFIYSVARQAGTMTITQLVTHSGGFHADELLSSVILTRLFPNAKLIRSRDAQQIEPAAGRIIYDVGGQFDAELGIFDHHQRPNPLRQDGQPYSSFGLSDAGPLFASLTLPVLLETLKPVFDDREEGADDRAFAAALPVARAFVEASIQRKAAKLRAEALVSDAIEKAGTSAVLLVRSRQRSARRKRLDRRRSR